jgi:hypothetical protein
MLIPGGFSNVIRGLWAMKVDGGGLNLVHTGNEHQLFYIYKAPVPNKTPRDSRTDAARFIWQDRIMQTRLGDAYYVGGGPRIDEHGLINESPDVSLIYIAIGVRLPGSRPGGGRGGRGGDTPPAKK